MFYGVITNLIDNPIYILIIIINLMIIVVIILAVVENRLKKEVKLTDRSDEFFYLEQLRNLPKSGKNTRDMLNATNKLAKNFFKFEFSLDDKLNYAELRDEFGRRKEREFSAFCELMLETIYSKDDLSDQRVNEIIGRLTELVRLIEKRKELQSELEKVPIKSKLQEIENLETNLRKYKIERGIPKNPLPSMPATKFTENFNRQMIKSAIEDSDNLEPEELPRNINIIPEKIGKNKMLELPKLDNKMPKNNVINPEPKKLPAINFEETKARPKIAPQTPNTEKTSPANSNIGENKFLKKENVQSAQEHFSEIKNKINEIQDVLKKNEKIRARKIAEASEWNKNLEKIKSKLSGVTLNMSEGAR